MGQRIDLPTLSGVADYRQITPTDIAQFIRLDQCERYLHTRAMASGRTSCGAPAPCAYGKASVPGGA